MKVIVFTSLLAVAVIAEIELTSEEGASSRQGRSLFFSRSSLYAPAVQSSGCPACAPTVNIGYSDVFPIVVTSLDGEKPVCGWRFTYDGKKPPSITCSQFQLFPFYESLHIYDDAYSFTREFAGVEGPVSLKFPASGVANVVLKRNGSNSPSSIQCIIAGGSPPACPAAFDAVGNTCIHVGDTGLSWDAAKTYCEGLNGHLAVISDLNTHQAISDYLTAAGAPEAVSIGARINAAGDYEWLDGTPLPATSLLWFIGFPDGNPEQECVIMVSVINNKAGNINCVTESRPFPLCQAARV